METHLGIQLVRYRGNVGGPSVLVAALGERAFSGDSPQQPFDIGLTPMPGGVFSEQQENLTAKFGGFSIKRSGNVPSKPNECLVELLQGSFAAQVLHKQLVNLIYNR